ncbi:hypothetical protein L2E82_29628 [Cichorium intybus]|uniref:Uncharacterized protein n=1 Tax=Cichorium intybus TaxID=13427 RepID=A0ACB9CY32_CICIN|nr:hypothetical protein L2E82_29628 [Cichorium intybus]
MHKHSKTRNIPKQRNRIHCGGGCVVVGDYGLWRYNVGDCYDLQRCLCGVVLLLQWMVIMAIETKASGGCESFGRCLVVTGGFRMVIMAMETKASGDCESCRRRHRAVIGMEAGVRVCVRERRRVESKERI